MLRDLDVLVLDCQASGATPAHGDLLEIGWAVTGAAEPRVAPRARWVVPSTSRPVSRAVRELTGWTPACLEEAVAPEDAWVMMMKDAASVRPLDGATPRVPTVIHFARFELPFLRALHARVNAATTGATVPAAEVVDALPFATVCLHAIAQRLFPDLPRKNLRAVAGHLGHSPELVRRSCGHVEASAFVWRAMVPALEARGVRTWEELEAWLGEPAPVSRGANGKRARGYPLPAERRRSLPDAPGVYRFLRPNGDVLYVGKAASLKRRVASHFVRGARTTERALEMLSQAHDVEVTVTGSALEAALLETDEIKRIDPPYNVQLRAEERRAWFASRDWTSVVSERDEEHPVGPLPSRSALAGLAAVRGLLERSAAAGGALPDLDEGTCAAALSVPRMFAPDVRTFLEGWQIFVEEHLDDAGLVAADAAGCEARPGWRAHTAATAPVRTRLLRAASRIVVDDADDAGEQDDDGDDAWDAWDVDRVRRRLERTVHQGGLLVRRAVSLALLSDATVIFREPKATLARVLVVRRGAIALVRSAPSTEAAAAASAADVAAEGPPVRPPSRASRQASFDAATYDRMRVLSTELRRVAEQGGETIVIVGRHVARLPRIQPVPRRIAAAARA